MAGLVNQPALIDMPRPSRRPQRTLAVQDGGTGANSLTDGGILLGSGTDAITAMAVLADSEMIVGDGSGDPVAESGDTLRVSIGVGSTDSPQFTGIEVGAATDTTVTRASAGDIAVEGNRIFRVGAVDVPVADGGTGGSTALAALNNLGAQGNRNLVINGAMDVATAPAATTITASQYGPVNRMEWIDTGTTSGAVTITQDTDVPTVAEAGVKFMNSIKIDCTTAEDLASADAALFLSHKIEAQHCTFFGHGATGALAARLSFWVKSTKTGIFTVNVDRDDASEKYSTEFAINTTDTWEFKSQTIPGDTDGTAIADDNGIGLALQIMMAVGGDGDTSTAGAWNASGATELATANQVNLLDSSSNNILITGLSYRLGSVDTPFDRREFAEELFRSQRYFRRWSDTATGYLAIGHNASTTLSDGVLATNQPMRAVPTLAVSGATDFFVDSTATTAMALTGPTVDLIAIRATVASGLVTNEASRIIFDGAGTRTLDLSAEL